MTYFGTNLKKIRQIRGLSQQAFAELIDLNRGVISSYEEGRAEPKIETLLRIANYFGIPTDDIISKPLTVNQLANFNLIEDSFPVVLQDSSFQKHELTATGNIETFDLQKIFAYFDLVYFVNDTIANQSDYSKNSVLFLKEVTNSLSNPTDYLILEDKQTFISKAFIPSAKNYAIVGTLGDNKYAENNSILNRLELLEKKVFGK
ncbi:XRE family transcriptional regulator [Flavobacterium sp. 9AF]|uniref:helix-turn-helix domain-containing protein n=1 Tax=Flavobacterium sp. 9AF TaxID=2653142 RepID=UPI0012F40B31|nr:helix-turn-helix transcriptional regulator [Flavobacterium sp. 9AF]VXB31851.1 XRE family transcriptional regulator [Flavobacterium sp. 9AF]